MVCIALTGNFLGRHRIIIVGLSEPYHNSMILERDIRDSPTTYEAIKEVISCRDKKEPIEGSLHLYLKLSHKLFGWNNQGLNPLIPSSFSSTCIINSFLMLLKYDKPQSKTSHHVIQISNSMYMLRIDQYKDILLYYNQNT